MSSPYFVLQKVPFQKGILDFTMFKEKKNPQDTANYLQQDKDG